MSISRFLSDPAPEDIFQDFLRFKIFYAATLSTLYSIENYMPDIVASLY